MNTNDQIRAIADGIIQCAIFADKPEGTNPRVTRQAWQAAETIAAQFQQSNIQGLNYHGKHFKYNSTV